jgi:ribosome biogenesis GTPase
VIGWDARWDAARDALDPDRRREPVRIAAEHRGAYHGLGPGGPAWCELPGRTYHEAADKRELPTVGDWVLVERWADALAGRGAAVIKDVLPRRSFLVRKAAGEATTPQPLAANVDTGLVMTSANADLSPARLDRYVALLEDGGIAPVLVLSKIDLVADPEPLLAELRAIAEPAIGVSTITGAGVDAIRAYGRGTAILLGSSGVGKSSLLNLLVGTAQPVGAIRDDDRGKHTTTRRELFATETGAWIDTPGLRELAHWVERDAEPIFDDIDRLAEGCRFRDCRHRDEPGCAVRDAVAADRLASFHKLLDERARATAAQRKAEARRGRIKRAKKPDP